MIHSLDAESDEILDRQPDTTVIEPPARRETAPGRDRFHVDEVGRNETFVAHAQPGSITIGTVVAEGGDDNAGVDDDQPLSRVARTALAAAPKLTVPPARPPARARTSSTVGLIASSTRRSSRYSWRDLPAAAARWRRVAWTSTGTSLTWMLGMTTTVAPNWRYYMCYGATTKRARRPRLLRPASRRGEIELRSRHENTQLGDTREIRLDERGLDRGPAARLGHLRADTGEHGGTVPSGVRSICNQARHSPMPASPTSGRGRGWGRGVVGPVEPARAQADRRHRQDVRAWLKTTVSAARPPSPSAAVIRRT